MHSRVGQYIEKTTAGETYRSYLPGRLPFDPPLDISVLSGLLERAAGAIASLNQMAKTIPNVSLFAYMYVRKEAVFSSQIEGTQSSLSDLVLFEHQQTPRVEIEDVEEVSHYVRALKHGLDRLEEGFPLSLRLLKEMHAVLLSGGRGSASLPGEFRRSQNWIGGTRPGNALFVPPDVEHLQDCLSNLEIYLHDETLPVLIKAAIAHVQFETIHPFLDGNGRLGRLLIVLLLMVGGVLDEPVLYISLYLKQNRSTYYRLLQEVREQGTWETWVEFFLEGVIVSSKDAIQTAQAINQLFTEDQKRIESLGRIKKTCLTVFEYLKKLPEVSASLLAQKLELSLPTARQALETLSNVGIVEEITGNQRGKVYVYKNYLMILEAI